MGNVVGQERFAYFCLGRHSGFSKVRRRQGGTLSSRYRRNGYVLGITVSTVRPSSQASQLPHLDRGVSGRLVSAGRPPSQASQLPHLDRGVSGRLVSAGRPPSQASQLPQGILRRLTNAENNNAPSRRGVVCSGADYFLAAGAAGASAASALAGSLMASSSRSNTSTELAGIAGLGLWAP